MSKSDFKSSKIQEFDRIEWVSDYTTQEVSKPEMPVYRVSYVLPIDAVVSGITFQVQEKQQLQEKMYVYPVQAPVPINHIGSIEFTQPDEKIYTSDAPYPGKLYDIESDDFFKDII
ncbi:hypothetical protein FACS189437_02410 [Bacteroidia bacterium]|nr:hypothetical protein FACS189437_02410 [Bacteroidia bacterium]